MNSVCVKTLDLRSPTGRPLAETTPSNGDRLFWGCEEKNSDPNARGDTLCQSGVGRAAGGSGRPAAEFLLVAFDGGGRASMYSYMSRKCSKFVGKKISKYPWLTKREEQGTIVFLNRVCTTGALYPGTVSGNVEKSDKMRRCNGKYVLSVVNNDKRRVGMNSG